MRRVGSEEELCFQLAQYLRLKYPDVIYHFDFGSGLKMTMGQAVRQKRLNNRSFPDLLIAQPAFMPDTINLYYGLFLEIKREGTRLKKRTGEWASPHIAEQAEILDRLSERGYVAQFSRGFDESVQLIESYLQGVKT